MVDLTKLDNSKVPQAAFRTDTHAFFVLELALGVYVKDAVLLKLFHFDLVELFNSNNAYYLESYVSYKTGKGFTCEKRDLYGQGSFVYLIECFMARYWITFIYHAQNLLFHHMFANRPGKKVYNVDISMPNSLIIMRQNKITLEVEDTFLCHHHHHFVDCAVDSVIKLIAFSLPEFHENELTCIVPLYKLQVRSPRITSYIPAGMESDSDLTSVDNNDDDDDHFLMKENENFFNRIDNRSDCLCDNQMCEHFFEK
jgi:hypothetical protein